MAPSSLSLYCLQSPTTVDATEMILQYRKLYPTRTQLPVVIKLVSDLSDIQKHLQDDREEYCAFFDEENKLLSLVFFDTKCYNLQDVCKDHRT